MRKINLSSCTDLFCFQKNLIQLSKLTQLTKGNFFSNQSSDFDPAVVSQLPSSDGNPSKVHVDDISKHRIPGGTGPGQGIVILFSFVIESDFWFVCSSTISSTLY